MFSFHFFTEYVQSLSKLKRTEKILKSLRNGMHYCCSVHDVYQFTAADQNTVFERDKENAVEFCQICNATVCLISHLAMGTGTEIYTAAKLLSAVPAEAKLCRLLAELFLD